MRENSDAFVVGMICRLVTEKGIEEFLKAAEIVNKTNKNCYFLLIGDCQTHDHAIYAAQKKDQGKSYLDWLSNGYSGTVKYNEPIRITFLLGGHTK